MKQIPQLLLTSHPAEQETHVLIKFYAPSFAGTSNSLDNYRYQSWQPVDTNNITSNGTKAPYYGSITVAAFLGRLDGDIEERPKARKQKRNLGS